MVTEFYTKIEKFTASVESLMKAMAKDEFLVAMTAAMDSPSIDVNGKMAIMQMMFGALVVSQHLEDLMLFIQESVDKLKNSSEL